MSAGSWDLRRGDEIDPTLVVLDGLGGGSRYEVFRAWDRELFCQVAVKVVRPDRVTEEAAITGFEREVAIAARMQHPNVVRLLRWRVAARPYLVLGLVDAGSLADHLDGTGPISVPEACLLGIRMCAALHHLHRNDVLHLDLKPANVTIGDPPVLLDLGLARTVAASQQLRHPVGTPHYMPPEQCQAGAVGPTSDLYSLAVTIYEGVSGHRPFPAGDMESRERERRYPQLTLEPVPLGEIARVPDRLEATVMRCLERDPARRPATAAAVAVALEGVLEEMRLDELLAWPRGTKVTSDRAGRGR